MRRRFGHYGVIDFVAVLQIASLFILPGRTFFSVLSISLRNSWELTSKGHYVELLTAKDERSLEPELNPDILGCLYYLHGGSANPVKTTRTLASLVQQQGAPILTNHEVTDIQYLDDETYQVVTLGQTNGTRLTRPPVVIPERLTC